MGLKAGFGEYSLPLDVREHLAVNYPTLPRSFVNGLRAISKAAFAGANPHHLARVEHAIDLLQTAEYFAPEFYSHTNAVLPDRVLTALAGEAELELSEDLDVILPGDTRALLIELREITQNPENINKPNRSQDARFVALVRLYHDIDEQLSMLFCGETDLNEDEKIQAIRHRNNLIQNVLDPEGSQLEANIVDALRRIDLVHQFHNSDLMWHIRLTRDPDFENMGEDDMLSACGIEYSDTMECALALLIEHRKRQNNRSKTEAFSALAHTELSELRILSRHFENITPSTLAYLLVQNDLDDEDFLDAVITTLAEEGEQIAYIHAARQDKAVFATLPEHDRKALDSHQACTDILDLEWNSALLSLLESHDVDFDPLREKLDEILDQAEQDLKTSAFANESIKTALSAACKRADAAITLAQYKSEERHAIPHIDNIDQKMTPDELRAHLQSHSPANS